MIKGKLDSYAAEVNQELYNILDYWQNFTVDHQYGGFVGEISESNEVKALADKGSVLNARILWSFSAAYNHRSEPAYLEMADRAFDYLVNHFIDYEFGGVYWTVDYLGNPADTKKQVYALAFTIYAFSEYYLVTKNPEVKRYADSLYQDLVKHSYDPVKGGYFEAFDRTWADLPDLRLSPKDANEKKTMNTHLHILEAFTNLYRVNPDGDLKHRIGDLLDNFHSHIVDQVSGNLVLFFDEDWNRKSSVISYGHDIEASWLILEAAEVIGEEDWIMRSKELAVKMSKSSLLGLDQDGGLWYEYDKDGAGMIKEKHWWVQAEAMIGFFNAWQLSADISFLDQSLKTWNYVQASIIDQENGEWFWGRQDNGLIMEGESKVGLWKCPYHNSRACLEIMKRKEQINF